MLEKGLMCRPRHRERVYPREPVSQSLAGHPTPVPRGPMLSRLTESGIHARLGLARGNRNLRHFWTEVAGTRIHTTVCFGRASSHQLSSAAPSQSVAVQALPTNNSTI
ncbi:hypothetical protein J6590_046905, partial [Homalodisca vitripennis]